MRATRRFLSFLTAIALTAAACESSNSANDSTTDPPAGESPGPVPNMNENRPAFPANTGEGVTIVILDRGIDYDHPDFVAEDGTTRIHAILDMSGQSYCAGSRTSVEYTRDQINAALASGEPLGTDDWQGHGTATAGMAAGDGSAVAGAPHRGVAPGATLLIVKASTEGAPATSYGPGEPRSDGCGTDALAWVDRKLNEIGQPAVGLWNVGAQWGPLDGTSQISREVEAVFGPDRPGRVWVASAGDDGGVPNHAGGTYGPGAPLEVRFNKEAGRASFPTAWLSGDAPGTITVAFDSGTTFGPVGPGEFVDDSGVQIIHYSPGTEFYPWTSDGDDYGIWMRIDAPSGPGVIRIESAGETGRADVYGDLLGSGFLESSIPFTTNLVPGRLSNLSSTFGAVVVGVHVAESIFQSEIGPIDLRAEGEVGELWFKSSNGPTRDGRDVLDVTAAGQNAPAPLAQNSYWASFRGNVLRNSDGYYVRFGGTSAAGPIVAGTVALMLEVNPDLTASEVKALLRATAVQDEFTGVTPNGDWGHGKLDIVAAVEAAAAAN